MMQTGGIIYLVGIFAVFYFLILRPQKKQQKERASLISSIKVDDKVVTIGGLFGTVKEVKDKSIILQISNDVNVEMLKTAIAYNQIEE